MVCWAVRALGLLMRGWAFEAVPRCNLLWECMESSVLPWPWWRGERVMILLGHPGKLLLDMLISTALGSCVFTPVHTGLIVQHVGGFVSWTAWLLPWVNYIARTHTCMHSCIHAHTHQCRYVHVAISVLCRTELSERSDWNWNRHCTYGCAVFESGVEWRVRGRGKGLMRSENRAAHTFHGPATFAARRRVSPVGSPGHPWGSAEQIWGWDSCFFCVCLFVVVVFCIKATLFFFFFCPSVYLDWVWLFCYKAIW